MTTTKHPARSTSTSRAARGAASVLAMYCIACIVGLAPARAQSVTALQDTTCAGNRFESALTCTSGEFTVGATFSAAPGSPAFCTAGQVFTFDASLALSGSNTDRYDIGFFVGQQGNAPTATTAGGICSVAVFPNSPLPFENNDADTCGDFNGGGVANPVVQGLKVVCSANTGSDLTIPYVLTYQQNTAQVCSSAANVTNASKSKCNSGSATLEITSVPVQVGGYVDVTKQTSPDGDAQTFSYTATGAAGSKVGVDIGGVFTANNTNAITFSLGDGQTARVFMSVISSSRALTIVEQATTHWQGTAAISCAAVAGSPTFTTNDSTRTITANLTTTNVGAACTVTNTKRARVSLVENVAGRLFAADQFALSVSGVGAATLTDAAGAVVAANVVAVTTSGAGTGTFTNPTHPNFRATAGQSLSLANAMAAGSTSTLASYDTTLTCTNAFTGPGATTGLPTSQAVSSYALTPAPGDDITCTYTNTPKALLTLSKVVVNDNGHTSTAADWTLAATGPVSISGISGSVTVTSAPVPAGNYTLNEFGPGGYAMTGLACTGGSDANPADGLVLVSGEKVTCTFTNDDQQVAQTVVKTGTLDVDPDGSGTVTEGDTLRYSVTVTNTGLVPLTGVQVSDAKLTPTTQACASVPVGGTCVLNGTHVVTAADALAGEIVNTASVVGNEIPGPVPSNTLITTVQAVVPGALAVVKSHVGDFVAGSNASYTLQVGNTGNTAISGTTTLEDTLASGLGFVSGTGTGWTCGAAGQLVTCTSANSVAAYGSMAPITLTVSVAGSMGSSVDNTASVGNSSVNGGAMAAGNTDTATILHPDLSTSTKSVVDLDGGDIEAGDILEYTINLVESAGAIANNVRVTDTLQAGLGSLVVTQVPGGGTDISSAGQVDVIGITVPASGSLQLRFRVTVGPGFTPGDTIDNTAVVDNPGGPDAAPVARTLIFAQSQVGGSGNKILYLHDNLTLDRTPQAGTTTAGDLVEAGTSDIWLLAPAIPAGETLVLTAGTIAIQLPIDTAFNTVNLQAQLFYRDPGGLDLLIGSSTVQSFSTSTVTERPFLVTLASDYTLFAGGRLGLRMVNTATGNKHARIYEYNGTAATITFATSTVVTVDSVQAYSQAFAGGNAQAPYYVHGDNVWIRAVTSDPFGGNDVSAAELTLTDPYGNVIVGPNPMSIVDTAGGSRTFEYATTVPNLVAIGTWTATVTAHEGSEGTVAHTANGTFELRGRVTLQQTWGAGANPGDAVLLQVTGGSDAVDGSSIAPSAATPATAVANATAPITLVQSFTTGAPGDYTIALSCVRDADGAALAISGTGLSRQINMPLDSSVTCTWTDISTVPLTIVKLAIVKSDPINGSSNPKAIPGAIVEYQVIITNPATSTIDSGSMVITDPVPDPVDLRVADLAGSGSGPVLFADGVPASGLTYTFTSLGSATDDVDFSSDGGATWNYVPLPDASGMDPAVTDIRINPKGVFNANNAQFSLRFRVRVE